MIADNGMKAEAIISGFLQKKIRIIELHNTSI
jgi:hypothetical protein